MTINKITPTLRTVKGEALTYAEMDDNFSSAATAVNKIIDQTDRILLEGVEVKLPSIYSLYLTGSGSVTIIGRDFSGNLVNNIATYNVVNDIKVYPIFEGYYSILAECTGTASAELI